MPIKYKKIKVGYFSDVPINGAYEVEYPDGDRLWHLNAKRHREDGPAVERANGTKRWYINGKCHREDGPAIEYPDGDNYWYLNDKCYSEKDYWQELYNRGKISQDELFEKLL